MEMLTSCCVLLLCLTRSHPCLLECECVHGRKGEQKATVENGDAFHDGRADGHFENRSHHRLYPSQCISQEMLNVLIHRFRNSRLYQCMVDGQHQIVDDVRVAIGDMVAVGAEPRIVRLFRSDFIRLPQRCS
jgi:hypothetical protein